MTSQVCPLLGLVDDRKAYLTYPSYENRCYALPQHEPIPLNEQTFFCLGGHRERCPRFQAYQADRPAGAPSSSQAVPMAEVDEDAAMAAAAGATADAGEAAEDLGWLAEEVLADADLEPDLPPPVPPLGYVRTAPGSPRRPVWPLLLAAGTLVAVLVLCGAVSATWLGFQTLSARLALQPTGTPIVEQETGVAGGVPITATLPSGGVIVVVVTPTPGGSGEGTEPGESVSPLPSPTATIFLPPTQAPTTTPFFPTPTELPTARPTPTSRATPTFVATPPPLPTPLPTPTRTLGATNTPSLEPFTLSFSASPTTINAGQAATLSWNVRGVRAIYLDGTPVSGPTGSKRVEPQVTTTYVLRVIKADGSVQEEKQTITVNRPSPTATPTNTPTATATPYYSITVAENRQNALIDGTGCQTGDGCRVFQIQVANNGNRPQDYWLEKDSSSLPPGWSAFFCFDNGCEFSDITRHRELAVNGLQTVSLNFLLPASVKQGQQGSITVRGYCDQCGDSIYQQTFTIFIDIPPTAQPTGTTTPSATPTPTATPTATSQASSSLGLELSAQPAYEATTSGSGCYDGDGCKIFDITVRNTSSAQEYYRAQVIHPNFLPGWDARICDAARCFEYDETNSRALNAGASEMLLIRLHLAQVPGVGQYGDFEVYAYLTDSEQPGESLNLRVRYAG